MMNVKGKNLQLYDYGTLSNGDNDGSRGRRRACAATKLPQLTHCVGARSIVASFDGRRRRSATCHTVVKRRKVKALDAGVRAAQKESVGAAHRGATAHRERRA